MFKYSLDNKRYHTLNYYYKNKYNSKVFKVSLNAGFTCPNIDGTKGYGGCTYCLNGSGEKDVPKDLVDQFNSVKEIMLKKNYSIDFYEPSNKVINKNQITNIKYNNIANNNTKAPSKNFYQNNQRNTVNYHERYDNKDDKNNNKTSGYKYIIKRDDKNNNTIDTSGYRRNIHKEEKKEEKKGENK